MRATNGHGVSSFRTQGARAHVSAQIGSAEGAKRRNAGAASQDEAARAIEGVPHGGSYPPGCHGWHRQIRRMPRHAPRTAPYLRTATTKYSLHEG
jgi:hypothetical protein